MVSRHAALLVAGIASLLLAAALLAGCGGGSAPGSADAAALARSDHAMLQFVRCMRSHGIDMADPLHRPGHSGLSIDLPERGPASSAAYQACRRIIQPIIEAKQAHQPAITESTRLGLIHYAECMRQHGVPMLDPTPQGALSLGNVPGIASNTGRDSPQFRLADGACRTLLPAGIHDDGSGP
jgi:hypothetical protein